jgi:hypothetical protein
MQFGFETSSPSDESTFFSTALKQQSTLNLGTQYEFDRILAVNSEPYVLFIFTRNSLHSFCLKT